MVDFLDTAMHSRDRELVLEDIKVGNGSPIIGATISDGQQFSNGATILVVKKRDGTLLTSLSQDMVLELEDELIVIGTHKQLRILEGLA